MLNIRVFLALVFAAVIVQSVTAVTTENTFTITTTNSDVVYTIGYSPDAANVTLTSYIMAVGVNMDAVQTWFLYGSVDGLTWTEIDTQTNVSFVSGVEQTFVIGSPAEYQFYEIRLHRGFYPAGIPVTLKFTTEQNAVTPPPLNVTAGAHGVIDHDYYLPMTNTRVLYPIDYGNDVANVTLLYYKSYADVTLLSVQNWDIFGSNDGTGWSLIDSERDIAVSIDSSRIFTIGAPKPYRYYIIYLENGYYNLGGTAVFIFTTDENGKGGISPTPTPTPSGTPTPYPTQVEGEQTSRITAEIGETYIKWSWVFEETPEPVNIYVNDTNIPVEMGYSQNSYLVTGLNAGEKHTIAIYTTNGTQLVGRASATTTAQSEIVYIVLALCFAFMIVALFLSDYKFIIVSIFNIILSLFGAMFASGHGALPFVFIGIAIISGLILLIRISPLIKEWTDW